MKHLLDLSFLLKLGLIEMDCNSFRTQSKLVDFIGFDRLTEKMPPGYKVKFQLSVVPNKTAAIVLSTAKGDFTDYEIRMTTAHYQRQCRNDIGIMLN